uniref:Agglutinin C-terminal domain-containing protein n=1 Tax=viral metagenome TaxID=1070528 RepID=A0A6M3L3R3_9ZZZZ
MKWWQLYLKTAWALKNPFVIPIDLNYKRISLDDLSVLFQYEQLPYMADFYDCDDFALVFKASASKLEFNTVGLVIGLLDGKWHVWNCAVCDEGVFQIEPQQARVFKRDSKYKPVGVII